MFSFFDQNSKESVVVHSIIFIIIIIIIGIRTNLKNVCPAEGSHWCIEGAGRSLTSPTWLSRPVNFVTSGSGSKDPPISTRRFR